MCRKDNLLGISLGVRVSFRLGDDPIVEWSEVMSILSRVFSCLQVKIIIWQFYLVYLYLMDLWGWPDS